MFTHITLMMQMQNCNRWFVCTSTSSKKALGALCLFRKQRLSARQVPEYLETAMYASYVELMDPFFQVTLPQIKEHLLKDSHT